MCLSMPMNRFLSRSASSLIALRSFALENDFKAVLILHACVTYFIDGPSPL